MSVRGILRPLLGLFVLSGCATTYKDFKTTNIKPNDGVAIGRVEIRYNGKPRNADCAVCFNSVNGPCQKLTPEGYVIQALPAGPATLRRIACKDVSLQHYNLNDAKFANTTGSVTYFGDVVIDWSNGGGFKASDMFGLVGALVSESKNDGVVKMTVSKNSEREVESVYSRVAKPTSNSFRENLIEVGR